MKQLYLVRHAKSSWREEGLADMDRPLKGRGVRDAYNTSFWLESQGSLPDLVLSSPATRALHTALIFSKGLHYSFSNIAIKAAIYEASTADLQNVVREIDDQYNNVFLFGHNPTITDFVNKCIDHRIDNVPTTGVACLKFNVAQWSEIGNKADLVFFDYPKRRDKK
jgi:phosphohistidine phosphatase